MKQNIFVII